MADDDLANGEAAKKVISEPVAMPDDAVWKARELEFEAAIRTYGLDTVLAELATRYHDDVEALKKGEAHPWIQKGLHKMLQMNQTKSILQQDVPTVASKLTHLWFRWPTSPIRKDDPNAKNWWGSGDFLEENEEDNLEIEDPIRDSAVDETPSIKKREASTTDLQLVNGKRRSKDPLRFLDYYNEKSYGYPIVRSKKMIPERHIHRIVNVASGPDYSLKKLWATPRPAAPHPERPQGPVRPAVAGSRAQEQDVLAGRIPNFFPGREMQSSDPTDPATAAFAEKMASLTALRRFRLHPKVPYTAGSSGFVELPDDAITAVPLQSLLDTSATKKQTLIHLPTLEEINELWDRVYQAENEVLQRETYCRVCRRPFRYDKTDEVAAHYATHRDRQSREPVFPGTVESVVKESSKALHSRRKPTFTNALPSVIPSPEIRKRKHAIIGQLEDSTDGADADIDTPLPAPSKATSPNSTKKSRLESSSTTSASIPLSTAKAIVKVGGAKQGKKRGPADQTYRDKPASFPSSSEPSPVLRRTGRKRGNIIFGDRPYKPVSSSEPSPIGPEPTERSMRAAPADRTYRAQPANGTSLSEPLPLVPKVGRKWQNAIAAERLYKPTPSPKHSPVLPVPTKGRKGQNAIASERSYKSVAAVVSPNTSPVLPRAGRKRGNTIFGARPSPSKLFPSPVISPVLPEAVKGRLKRSNAIRRPRAPRSSPSSASPTLGATGVRKGKPAIKPHKPLPQSPSPRSKNTRGERAMTSEPAPRVPRVPSKYVQTRRQTPEPVRRQTRSMTPEPVATASSTLLRADLADLAQRRVRSREPSPEPVAGGKAREERVWWL